ncbi:MAG: hypothetical protein ACK4XN_12480 [Dolichospermum sp.]|jgi:hypothetical protein
MTNKNAVPPSVELYKDTLLIDHKLHGYIDLAKDYCNNYGCGTPIVLKQRPVFVNGEFYGFSYTLDCIPQHPGLAELDYTKAFEALTKAEREINPYAGGWSGQKTIGCSGWDTPSLLNPKEIIDIVLDVLK